MRHVLCVHGLQEMSSVHAERADKQLWLEFKRQQVEAEVWRKYHASRTGQSMAPGKVWHALHSPRKNSISPPHSLGGEEGSSPGTAPGQQRCGKLPRQGSSACLLPCTVPCRRPQEDVCRWRWDR